VAKKKHISGRKRAATKKAGKRHPDPALLTPRHGWDEVAHNWEALHAGAEEVPANSRTGQVDSLGPGSSEQSENVKPTGKGRGGRPRKDEERDKVREKHASRKSWKVIQKEMNTEMHQEKTADAYRALLRPEPRKKKTEPN